MLHINECWRGGLEEAWEGGVTMRPGWWMTFQPGARDFTESIEALKRTVPPTERSYEPETHHWWISEEWAMPATAIIGGLEAHLRQGALL